MKTNRSSWILLIMGMGLLAFAPTVKGQMKFYTAVSEGPLVAGQTFQVQFVVENPSELKQFTLPPLRSFTVHDSFDSKSTTFQSPGLTRVDIYSKIVVLSVSKAGTYTVPGAKALVDGKWRKFNDVKVTVVNEGVASAAAASPMDLEMAVDRNSELRPGESVEKKLSDQLFMRAIASKEKCYAGEGIMVTYKFYSRINTSSQVLRRPSLTGFSVVEMVDGYEARPDIEIYNGQQYFVNLVRKVQLFPIQAGKFPLEPAEVSSTVHFMRSTSDPSGKKDDLDKLLQKGQSGSNASLTPYDYSTVIRSQPLTIEAIPLPVTGQPENFGGAIGQFTVSMVSPSEPIHAGELVKIRLIINGTGNIPLLVPPVIKWPKGVDTADPVVKEVYNKYVFPLQGYKSFEYSFTAPDTGVVELPAATLYYFDPVKKTYQSASNAPIKLTILPALPKKEPPVSNETTTMVIPEGKIPPQYYGFAVVALAILGWISFQVFGSGKKKENKETAREMEEQPAVQQPLVERISLDKAREAFATKAYRDFYRELQSALWKLSGDYCGLPPSEQNKLRIQDALRKKGTAPEIVEALIQVQQECDWALYTTASPDNPPSALLDKAQVLVGFFHQS